ncbi:peroxide stress protein YaaA [Legionella waltersii]|uniref:UPF0246 protein Lwal_0810 n=1 Tax=Legionella waltersii TaxID=66969 RepID=A0A0W1ALU9_9GAMM|nr:peroxide stress protein YaaA [Legionella waltersii]KTD82333.1 hypothetical protein Lwal_0810 [Legionella waltersii]SNV03989.1 protein YaaA [Legionella waltersii]
MLTLLSPAKKLLDFKTPFAHDTTDPILLTEANRLAQIMKEKTVDEIAHLMNLSKDLAQLNYKRYQQFHLKHVTEELTYPSLYLFQGDVYQGLQAASWSSKDVSYAQEHLGILSGLYGLLRPLDRIQPYRLEMGVSLSNPEGKNLYAYWDDTLAHTLNRLIAHHQTPALINLASSEYFKAVNGKKIKCPIITVNFYEKKGNDIKMIGLFAKRARGMMARFLMQNQIDTLDDIQNFNEAGYVFNREMSNSNTLSFVCLRS